MGVKCTVLQGGDRAGACVGDVSKPFSKIESAVSSLKDAIKGDNKAAIEAKLKALGEASAGMAQRLYGQQGEAGAASGGGDNGDNVVDAEFEEVKDDEKKQSA